MAEWVIGKSTKIKQWTDSLFSIIVNDAPISPFVAGQFTKIAMEINGKRVQRAYSYVNAPSNPNLEFYLVTVPNGELSQKIAQLRPGSKVMLSKDAAGFFVLDEIPDCEDLWMLATGTGIGPYLSILQEGSELARFKQIILVHAARFTQDLSYSLLLKKLQHRYNGKLRIQTIISREKAKHSLTGRIPVLIKNGILEAAVGLTIDPKTSHVMLCGNPQMVHDTQQILQVQRQMRKCLRRMPGHITSELYW